MAGVTANFLHRKSDGSVWYYRRRYPAAVAQALGKAVFMRSLKTADKQEATRLSRVVSVEFDNACAAALAAQKHTPATSTGLDTPAPAHAKVVSTGSPDPRLAIPSLVKRAVDSLLSYPAEEYHEQKDWSLAVLGLMERGEFPRGVAGAEPLHPVQAAAVASTIATPTGTAYAAPNPSTAPAIAYPVSMPVDIPRALTLYREKVGDNRYRQISRALEPMTLVGDAEAVQQQLKAWAEQRLLEVQPRSVKVTLTGLVSCLRCVLPDLKAPELRALRGVLEPKSDDRRAAPIKTVQAIVREAELRIPRTNDNVSARWDALVLRCLAILGCRPAELLKPEASVLIERQDVQGKHWTVLRIQQAKNKSSLRDIPLNADVLPITQLREFLAWRDKTRLKVQASVNSLNMRLRSRYLKSTPDKEGITTYSLRHTWAAIAKDLAIDFEVRERILGHKVQGMATVYGDGIPMQVGLEAMIKIRETLCL